MPEEALPQLLQAIANPELREALAGIRTNSARLWDGVPVLVRNYTDHGPRHSQRVLDRLQSILLSAPASFRPLDDDELFVLIASCYLHDIGMQCDLARHPEVVRSAQGFGSSLETDWTSADSASLSAEEQTDLRKAHGVVTAAWLHVSLEASDSIVHTTASLIPRRLFQDVLDVCRYHTASDIADCPPSFHADGAKRLRLLAALLRFADELDISFDRADLQAALEYRVPAENLVWFYLHSNTVVSHPGGATFVLTVRLEPADFELYSEVVEAVYVREFEKKNEATTRALWAEGLPASIDASSRVQGYAYAEKLPEEVRKGLLALYESKVSADGAASAVFAVDDVDRLTHRLEEAEERSRRAVGSLLDSALEALKADRPDEALRLGMTAKKIEASPVVDLMIARAKHAAGDAGAEKVLADLELEDRIQMTGLFFLLTKQYRQAFDFIEANERSIRLNTALLETASFAAVAARNHPAAAKWLSHLIDQEPRAEYYAMRSDAHRYMKEPELALADAEAAITADEHVTSGYLSRGAVYGWLGRYDEAISDFQRVLDIDADSMTATCYMATAMLDANNPEGAHALARTLVESCSDCEQSSLLLAKSLRAMGQHNEAIVWYDRILKTRQDNAPVLYERGRSLLEVHRPQDALVDFQLVLSMDSSKSSNRCAKCQMAQAHLDLGDTDEAIKLLDEVLLDPTHDECETAHFSRGLAFFRMGEIGKALDDFRVIATTTPSDENYLNLACAAIAAGLRAEALDAVRRALEAEERFEPVATALWFKHAVRAMDSNLDTQMPELIDDLSTSIGYQSNRTFDDALVPLRMAGGDPPYLDVLVEWAHCLNDGKGLELLLDGLCSD